VEKAFSSTSMNLGFEGAFAGTASKSGAIQLNIRAKASIRGVNVVDLSNHHHEQEVVLDKGVAYVIRSIRKAKGYSPTIKYIAEVDAIGHV
jgi:hypothetical protein